ncbi:hypothetical protein [Rathayibacter tritici]|nr:hypothetical protein [Rathayibacter tritici]
MSATEAEKAEKGAFSTSVHLAAGSHDGLRDGTGDPGDRCWTCTLER